MKDKVGKNILAKNKPELLAPAGSLEKMKVALAFGADAVYFGLPDFSLRARINKFGVEELKEGAKICRELGKKFYLTFNIFAHERHFEKLDEAIKLIKEIKPDALIVADPGIINVLQKKFPKMPLHLSTQANATNSWAVKFWQKQGIERVILARELTLDEIAKIKKEVPEVELETFVHGAMCMAYSGRCLLSKMMTGREANLGDCAQPCRWRYKSSQKLKVKSQKVYVETEYFPSGIEVIDDKGRFGLKIEQDENGAYFFNSFDLCLIEYLEALMKAGVDSFKIEGRGKSVYYVAVATRAYRKVIDAICGHSPLYKKGQGGVLGNDGSGEKIIQQVIQEQKEELEKLTNRGYTKGFLLGGQPEHLLNRAMKEVKWEFVGISEDKLQCRDALQCVSTGECEIAHKIFVHNVLKKDDEVEIITPKENIKTKIKKINNQDGEEILSAHGGQNRTFLIELADKIEKGTFLIRKGQEPV